MEPTRRLGLATAAGIAETNGTHVLFDIGHRVPIWSGCVEDAADDEHLKCKGSDTRPSLR
jgi:hypothetical protein